MSEPDQRLYFLLQRAAHRLRTTQDRRCLAAAGVTTAQLGALFAVKDQPSITQQELARTLGLRESAVTALVARLTAARLLTKEPHPLQHRAVVLELTDAGAEALRAAQPEIDRFNAELRALLGDEGFVRTAGALHRLAHWEA
ncbi:MarR family winged helix-turn-helix transcriptional regulator [Streptomyces cylindrosporus]|uniref:MarR family winged helix-turn-helix transcriptional regulator n=1 Tax=Streptomyces cylindrosporus TaxID=2927583 RepID=A0ABS9YP38_9ACTN|nr:MarR family winged helix-turn-helix transcriptional regulator [Streptomyces cylindrosporus]MCI3278320.1 MarR family winged helix-turn-helix transcriptional regulator [Streptomyces cylindrosporus]